MMINLAEPEIQFALSAVGQAALLVEQVQHELASSALTKDDRSPVTVGDLASQALVSYLLSQAFPSDLLVAEEESASLRKPENRPILDSVTQYVSRFLTEATPELVCDWIDRGRSAGGRRFWAFDPIDGTKGYLREGQYAVALALLIDGEPQVGVLGCPELTDAYRSDLDGPGSLVVAACNQGAWTTALASPGQYEQLHVSARSDPSQVRLLRSYEDSHTDPVKTEALVRQLGSQAIPVRMDSQAKYAVLAAGKADALVRFPTPQQPDYREKIWDQAAGSIVLTEAGGCITDVTGRVLDSSTGRTLARNTGILGTNGKLHNAFVHAIQTMTLK